MEFRDIAIQLCLLPIAIWIAWILATDEDSKSKGNSMLVLSRKRGEQIKVGEVVFTVLRIDNRGNVKIGIDAPQEMNITRVEIDDGRDGNSEATECA